MSNFVFPKSDCEMIEEEAITCNHLCASDLSAV